MSRPRIRPTFEETLPTSIARVTSELIDALKDEHAPVRGKVGRLSAEIVIVRAERVFWSPHLSLAFDERDGRAIMFGRFSPHPSVWSGFVASYALFAIIAICGSIGGYSQWSIGQRPTALYAVLMAMVGFGTSYGAAFIGQSMALDQVYAMRHFVDRCIERASERERDPTATAS